ncbi:MAG: hypothetical protein ABIZ80_24315 [Bryobacteraceae bacterium]
MMFARIAAAGVALCTLAWSAPQLTIISDVLFKADGTRFNGIAQIVWMNFESGNATNIAAQSRNVRIIDGNLFVRLTPTTNAVPNAFYKVKYNSDGRVQFQETWAVPPATSRLRVRDVRTTDPQLPGGVGAVTQIQESDVIGLVEDLAARPIKSPTYVNERAVWVNSLGELETVAGNVADCVHVDGTAGPCGASVDFIDAETPTGTVNGANTAFTLAQAPSPALSLSLFRNGVLLKPSTDFSLTGSAVTFTGPAIPQTWDQLIAYYRRPSTTATVPLFVDGQSPSGAVDGSNAAFTLSNSPAPASSLQVFRNGLLQKLSVDYSFSGVTIQFTTGSIPQPGDTLLVSYRR